MNVHLFSLPNPTGHAPCPRLREEPLAGERSIPAFSRKGWLGKTQLDLIARGDPIVSQMNQAGPVLGQFEDGTSARGLCLRSSVKTGPGKGAFSSECCPRILGVDFSLNAGKREET